MKKSFSKKTGKWWTFRWQHQPLLPAEEFKPIVVPDREEWSESDPANLIIPDRGRGCVPQISNYGRTRDTNGIATPTVRPSGYSQKAVNGKIYQVHRLVYFAFVGLPPTSEHLVDHKIERYKAGEYPNRVDNLQALTHEENMEKVKNRASGGPQLSKAIRGRRKGEDWSGKWANQNECADALGVAQSTVRKSIAKCWTCKGWHLEFAPVADLEGEVWAEFTPEMFEQELELSRIRKEIRLKARKTQNPT